MGEHLSCLVLKIGSGAVHGKMFLGFIIVKKNIKDCLRFANYFIAGILTLITSHNFANKYRRHSNITQSL